MEERWVINSDDFFTSHFPVPKLCGLVGKKYLKLSTRLFWFNRGGRKSFCLLIIFSSDEEGFMF